MKDIIIKPKIKDFTGLFDKANKNVNSILLNNLRNVLKTNTTIPTYIPKNFLESFYLYTDGTDSKLYVYINNIWENIGGSKTICGKMYPDTTQATTGSVSVISMNKESFSEGITADTTNYRFIIITPGYYRITGEITFQSPPADTSYLTLVAKNGSTLTKYTAHSSNTDRLSVSTSDIVYLDTDDYIDLRCYQSSGTSVNIREEADETFLIINKI